MILPASAQADQADQGQVSLSSSVRGSALAINSTGKSVPVWYTAGAETGSSLPPVIRATIDTSASKAVRVELRRPSPGCQTSPDSIVCERSPDGRHAANGDLQLRLTPAPGAAVGDQAEITITVTAPKVETSVQTFDFTISPSGPDLQLSNSVRTVAPGEETVARPAIRNSGDQPAPTILLSLYGGSYTRFPVHYRNCHYQTDSYGFESGVCLLKDINLAPGETLTPARATPFPTQVKSTVPGQLRLTRLDPAGQPYETYLAYSVDAFDTTPTDDRLDWPLGDGPELSWQRTSTAGKPAPMVTEADPWDNYGQEEIKVSPDNPTDIVGEGATVTGAVGDVVTATVGLRNQGPADVESTPEGKGGDPFDPYDAALRFTPPKNTEVVGVVMPPGNYYQEWYQETTPSGQTEYLVLPFSLAKGQEYLVQFSLRITAAGSESGTVVGQGGTHDPLTRNNTATVSVSSSS